MSSAFPETRWTQVERCQGSGEDARLALGELCAACHRPVQAFVRNWCRDEEQAKDLTQEFFARLLARPHLEAERGRGRFRSYLLGAVKHFLCEVQQADRTQKRGGSVKWVELDLQESQGIADASALPPDVLFDQQWACALLDRALKSLAAEMHAATKGDLFDLLRPWLAGNASHGDQLQAADQLGLSETAIRVQVHRLRKRYREWIEAEVRQTLTQGGSMEEEMQHLFSALAGR